MSPLSWLLLLVIYFATLVVGMLIFHSTECPKELETLRAKRLEDLKLTALVNKMENMLVGKVYEELDEVLEPGEMEELVRIWSGKVVTRENQKAGNESQPAEVCVLFVPMTDRSSYFKSRYQNMTAIWLHSYQHICQGVRQVGLAQLLLLCLHSSHHNR